MSDFDWSAVGSIGTAVAVLIAAWQMRRSAQQARTDFEDDLSREYRELARQIPVKALLGESLQESEFENAFPWLYKYIELTNEQVFLRKAGRVSCSTWMNWADGIKSNLKRPAFELAWERIRNGATESFNELRRLEQSKFVEDPRSWVPLGCRLGFCRLPNHDPAPRA